MSKTSVTDIVERLRRTKVVASGFMAGKGSFTEHALINPDGPKAATEIEALRAREAELLSRIDERLKVEERLHELGMKYCDQIDDLQRKLNETVTMLSRWVNWSAGQRGGSPFFDTKAFLASIRGETS